MSAPVFSRAGDVGVGVHWGPWQLYWRAIRPPDVGEGDQLLWNTMQAEKEQQGFCQLCVCVWGG